MRLLTLLLLVLCQVSLEARQPNVVVILTDDQGWGDLSLNGNSNLTTPRIDSLAKDGASFERFYVCPVCSPTRAEFLTGRYSQRGGVYSTSQGGERLDLDEVTIADSFKAAGYKTAAFGKWHNGMQYPYHPNGRGFDEFYGFCSGHWGHYFGPMLEHNGKIVKGEGFVIDDFTNKAMAFMEKHKEEPFLVYLPYNTPHSPMQVPDEYWKRFEKKELKMRHRDPGKEKEQHLRCALAMCENIDWNVGRVLDKLDELKLRDDTIVVFFHDNGPNGARWNGGMKGWKGSLDEGGVRSPLLVRWPREIDAGLKITAPGAALDLLPTLASLAAIEHVGKKELDGVDLSMLLRGKTSEKLEERPIFNAWKNRVAVRTKQFRLSHDDKLFDMIEDPGQRKDVAKEFPETYKDLLEQRDSLRKELVTELGKEERPFVIAHPEYEWSQIPARDGKPHGGIKRSNRHPNDTFFTNWKSTEDKITWTAEVAAEGTFEVQVYYTCPAENVGAEVELSFGEAKLTGKIDQAVESELIGPAEDHFPRIEGPVQDWGSLSLGTMQLEKGTGELTLRATKIPGEEVMDFRLLMLRRVK